MIVRLSIVLGVLALIAVLTLLWRRREGRFSEARGVFDPADLGLGRRDRGSAVLVDFFADWCSPCRTVEQRVRKVADELGDVRVVKIDADARIDLAKRYDVHRVPTLFVTDPDLRIIWRASGVPTEEAIRNALLGPDWAGRPHTEDERATL